jgi:protein-S-isoprenylcysteine O-methyltransferase Ste14
LALNSAIFRLERFSLACRVQNENVKDLNKKALIGLLRLLLTIAACIFLPAWTLRYWQAWVLLSVLFGSLLVITLYLMKNDPRLLERRVHAGPGAEKQRSQQIGQLFGAIAFIAAFLVPAIDHRFAWSSFPALVAIGGDFLVALGLLIVFFVFKENTFTSAIIEIAAEQRLVSTGPYSTVRHPMYAGALIMMLGVSPALGSWWGLSAIVPMASVIVRRVREEEELLTRNLAGYREYRNQVHYRLLPFVW